ncbi:Copia protein [Araneus ventricosus]|uniref:Copia protein n=1 Tax=Araneus ventricosus TaxID=182803 RepID=A0A4Y2HYI2_ARAVE|nr:Copia protein [Araneus ventricosus]
MISRTVKFVENSLPYARKELRNQEEKTKQLHKLDLEHEENQKMEEEESNERIEVNPCEDEEKEDDLLPNNTQYRQAIRTLLYVATVSRPDISVAVNILSRRNEKPRERDWNAVKRIIRYLKTTAELKLIINKNKEPILNALCDADWANDKSNRKSTSGNLFKLGNSPIQWTSKRQNCVELSTTEAEYVSSDNTAQECIWLINLAKDLDLPKSLPVTIYEDNQSCIKLSQSDKYHSRTKHIDVKFHNKRHLRETGMTESEYCQSKEMTVNILTKPLPRPQHRTNLQLKTVSYSENKCWTYVFSRIRKLQEFFFFTLTDGFH